MRYKFDSTFIELGYIKELLKEFNLPQIQVATDSTKLYDGCLYIKDLGIYKYNKSNDKLVKISDYYFNRPILNITTNMNITTSQYSSDIHEYLGNYLRFLRDYKDINLMSLYNCFSNRTVFLKNEIDDEYNYYAIPVKFGQVYTIGFDSAQQISMYCTLWNNTEIEIDELFNIEQFLTQNDINNLKENTSFKVPGCCIDKPFIYTALKDFDASKFVHHFDDLRLIIKIPTSNKTSITVLEGDYSFNSSIDGWLTTKMYHGVEIDKKYYKTYPTKLSLFRVNDEQKHPFADRLIEYLLDTAITSLDKLNDNIKRVQEYLMYLRHETPQTLYGI